MAEHSELATRRGEVLLDDGTALVVRPLLADDGPLLVEGFEHLSERSRYHRFFSPLHELGPTMLLQLTDLDYHDRFAWIAFVRDGDREIPAAVVRYFAIANQPGAVELAITVVDDYQGRGIGSVLAQLIARTAAANGFTRLEGQVLAENGPMRALLAALHAKSGEMSRGVVDFGVDLQAIPAPSPAPRDQLIAALARGLPPR